MKYQHMIDMLFVLLAKRRISAGELAARYNISVRTVYRYIDEMTVAGIPIDVARGAGGGIYISDTYKLPKGYMTREEYESAIGAMQAMESELGDPALSSAISKLSAKAKEERQDGAITGNILVDSGTWGNERKFSEKLTLLERAIAEKEALEIDYIARDGERTRRIVLPHLLVYKQNIWYVYAYCRLRGAFRLFKIGRMRSILKTGEHFSPMPFSRDDVPLSFWTDEEQTVQAKFLISPDVLPFAEEWLGIENVREEDGQFVADVTLPDDDQLVEKILSAGAGFKVLSPAPLAERVRDEARKIAESYSN